MIKAPSKKSCYGGEGGRRRTSYGWSIVDNFKFTITTDLFA